MECSTPPWDGPFQSKRNPHNTHPLGHLTVSNILVLYKEINQGSRLLSDYIRKLSQNHAHRDRQIQELNTSLLMQAQYFSTNLQLPLYIHLEI